MMATDDQMVSRAIHGFGFALLQGAADSARGQNVVLSPLGIAMSLGMLANGSNGQTLKEILETLQLPGGDLAAFGQGIERLSNGLRGPDRAVSLELANALWYREGFRVSAGFVQTNREHYDADVLPFSLRSGVAEVNRWVEAKTHGQIPSIVQGMDPSSVMFLVDALYFQGKWKNPFDPANTTRESFLPARGGKIPVDLMLWSGKAAYAENDRFQAVDLPYGNGQVVMTAVLPREGVELSALLASLRSPQDLGLERAVSRDTLVWLPRLDLGYESSLNGLLQSLGMKTAFTSAADFSAISDQGSLVLGNVLHKTRLKVDEQGAEASAATSTEVRLLSYTPPARVRLDRPFLFLIRDLPTGALLFLGQVEAPTAAQSGE